MKINMKLLAPKYYKSFVCIADKCRHSCCIGWEIDVDERTMDKYAALENGYGETVKNSIEMYDAPHFRLCGGDRCPHLDRRGLCRIITNLGEGYLCDICREHPRFYNDTPDGKEVGLGLSCEEACRIVLSSDEYKEIEAIGEIEGRPEKKEFDPLPYRRKLYGILSAGTIPYAERLRTVYEEYGVSPACLEDSEWRELLASLEYLDPSHRRLFGVYTSDITTPTELEAPLERALAYFIYRHMTSARDENGLRAALGFALFCERLLCSAARSESDLTITEIARIISEELEYSEDNTETVKLEFWF